ncbi:MAG TPA: hypothetical protein VFB79_15870 [Candidatus Angelobacter sp.]|nr:hypothetical protein [Candidatus Angelobacter sp.]
MRLALVGLLGLSMLKSCNVAEVAGMSPDAIAQKYQDGLRPYFPHARAQAVPQQETLLGLTCTQGDGPALVDKVKDMLPETEDVKQLKMLRSYGPILGAKTYHFAALGFQSGIIRLNVDTWQAERLEPWTGYSQFYDAACGFTR